jgi:hypothetical protein
VAALDDAARDRRYLMGRLSQRKDYFGKALTNRPVMVDAGEADVLERLLPELGQELLLGFVATDATVRHCVEKHS